MMNSAPPKSEHESRPRVSPELGRIVSLEPPAAPPHRAWLAKRWTAYAGAQLSHLDPSVVAAYHKARAAGCGLYLWSEYKGDDEPGTGVGKTYALVAMFDAVATEWWERHQHDNGVVVQPDGTVTLDEGPALWLYTDIIDSLKHDISRKPDEGPMAYPYFARINPLFVDDIGAGRPTQWVSERVYTLLNERNNKKLVTYFTCNHPLDVLRTVLNEAYGDNGQVTVTRDGHRIVSRIAEHCIGQKLEGPDRRLS